MNHAAASTETRVIGRAILPRTRILRAVTRAEGRELILHGAANWPGVSKMTVVRLIPDGLLPARQVCAGAPYVIQEDDLDRPEVRRAVETGRAVSPDARQKTLSFQ